MYGGHVSWASSKVIMVRTVVLSLEQGLMILLRKWLAKYLYMPNVRNLVQEEHLKYGVD